MYRLHYVSVVDIIKKLYCRNFFNNEIEFTIVQLALRLFRVLSATSKLLHFLVYLEFTASYSPPPPPPVNTPLNVIMFAI